MDVKAGDIVINTRTGQSGRIILIETQADPHHHDQAVDMAFVEVANWRKSAWTISDRREWWMASDVLLTGRPGE